MWRKMQNVERQVPEILAEAGEYKSMTVDTSWADVYLNVTKRSRLIELIQYSKWVSPQVLVFKQCRSVVVDSHAFHGVDNAAQYVWRLRATDACHRRLWHCRRHWWRRRRRVNVSADTWRWRTTCMSWWRYVFVWHRYLLRSMQNTA